MAFIMRERGRKECADSFVCLCRRDEPRADGKDIRIIMAAREAYGIVPVLRVSAFPIKRFMRGHGAVEDRSANAWETVRAHSLALSAACTDNADRPLFSLYFLRKRLYVVRIVVVGIQLECAAIFYLMPQKRELLKQHVLKTKTGVVACEIYFHT